MTRANKHHPAIVFDFGGVLIDWDYRYLYRKLFTELNKPDPRLFALFLNTIGRTAGECVFIDDSATNVATARRLGFTTIQYESPEQLKFDLQAMGLLP